MAATETLYSIKGNILLNNGTTTTGSIKTLTQSMGNMSKTGWDVDKVANILTVIAPLFTKSVYRVRGVKTYDISES